MTIDEAAELDDRISQLDNELFGYGKTSDKEAKDFRLVILAFFLQKIVALEFLLGKLEKAMGEQSNFVSTPKGRSTD